VHVADAEFVGEGLALLVVHVRDDRPGAGGVRLLEIDPEKVNGSGCSLGHPIAATGGRMLSTLVHQLRRQGGGIGVAAMCAGGGMGGATVIEVLAP
jgi:acetyl-CoA acetyltransferase